MGMFSKFLSELNKGDIVKITQTNGQVLEGTVMENDGEEAVSLQIVMNAVIRYSAVDSVSVISHSEVKAIQIPTVSSETAVKEKIEKSDMGIADFPKIQPLVSAKKLNFNVSKEQFTDIFGQLAESDRILMQSAYEMTVQEYESFDDTNNVHMAETYLVKFAENGNTSDGKKADIAAANGLALLENFRAASDYFYYGDEMRNAYLSAYEGAYRADDEKLYQKAGEYAALREGETLLDLYCGAGTIGICTAGENTRLIGVEVIPEAVENARKNAALNGMQKARFICADAAAATRILREEGIHADCVIIDPPRKGCDEKTIDNIISFGASRLVYVSCNPATLARDLKLFESKGYKAVRACAADMFPRTAHVECVVLMSRIQA